MFGPHAGGIGSASPLARTNISERKVCCVSLL